MIFSKPFNEQSAALFDELPQLHELGLRAIASPFNLFEWYLKPHVNSPEFPERTDIWMQRIAKQAGYPIYALDDESAIKITAGNIAVISEGQEKYYKSSK